MLAAERSQHVMGLYRRAEMVAALERTLESIRTTIPLDRVRVRFDRIFRPAECGSWISTTPRSPGPAAVRQRSPGRRPAPRWPARIGGFEHREIRARGSAASAVWLGGDGCDRLDRLCCRQGIPVANGLGIGQRGAAASERLHRRAAVVRRCFGLFLRERWAPKEGGRSVQDYVRQEWLAAYGSNFHAPLPRIETRWFGYPQAVPQYGVPPALFQRLIHADNAGASEWLRQNGQPDLLRTLRWLPQGDTSLALLHTGTETLRLTTVLSTIQGEPERLSRAR